MTRRGKGALWIGAALAVPVAVALGWRAISRKRSLPCPSWLAWGSGPLADRISGTRLTLERLELRPGQRVLEVGAGWGRLAVPAAGRVSPGGSVTALDIQPAMLARLRLGAERESVGNVWPVLGDAVRLPFRSETFDTVYLATVLGEIPGREAALGSCFEVLKPGGLLSITELMPDPHFQRRAAVRRMAEAAGFRLRRIDGPWHRFTAAFERP